MEQGNYVAICFIPDPATGRPHFLLGMAQQFTVGAAAPTTMPTTGDEGMSVATVVLFGLAGLMAIVIGVQLRREKR